MVHIEVGWGHGVAGCSILGEIEHWEPHSQIQLPCNVAGYGAVSCDGFPGMARV